MPNGKKNEYREDCACAETEGDMHTCPYAEDINGDSESLCDCCAVCEHECAMDI